MKQSIVMDLFDKMENKELNNEIKKIEEDKVTSENENVSDIKEIMTNLNGIVEVRYGDKIYKIWKVKFIRPLIKKILKEKYLYSLVVRELNGVDLTIIDRNTPSRMPVEIQKAPITSDGKFAHTVFEGSIRSQIDINIEIYNKCWLFMDSEYLRYLQSGDVPKNTSIDMTWLVKLMREDKLKIFSIKYDGIVKELITKDFDFLKDISQICAIGCDNDERILTKNKVEIYNNVVLGYNFTQEEIFQFENDFDNYNKNEVKGSQEYFIKNGNERCKLYGYILSAIKTLPTINNILSCKMENKKSYIYYSVIIGLFHQNEFHGNNNYARIQFIDKFNVARYFPGYLRNKEMWDYCKTKQRIFPMNEFKGVVEGREHCLKLIKNQSKSSSDYD